MLKTLAEHVVRIELLKKLSVHLKSGDNSICVIKRAAKTHEEGNILNRRVITNFKYSR